jgi:hypothetical protein
MKFVSVHYLPEHFNNFNHASVKGISIGPRQAITLHISPIVWEGIYGEYPEIFMIKFSAIDNFDSVSAQFSKMPYDISEVGYLGPDESVEMQKEGAYRLRFSCERIDYEFTFKCGKISISEPSSI